MAHLARGARQGVMNVSLKSRIEARDRQSMFYLSLLSSITDKFHLENTRSFHDQ